MIASIESQLGGQAQFDWRSEGLMCRLEVPLTPKSAATSGSQDKFEAGTSPELQRASG